MLDTSTMQLPTTGVVRRLTKPLGNGVPDEIELGLLRMFLSRPEITIFGVIAAMTVNLVGVMRVETEAFANVFWSLLLLDSAVLLCLCVITTVHIRGVKRDQTIAPDSVLLLILFWSALVGFQTCVALLSGDPVMRIIAPVTTMGIIAIVVARYNMAPRLAVVMVILLDIPYKLTIPVMHDWWLLPIALTGPIFVLIIARTVRDLHETYVRTLVAERESSYRATHDPMTGLLNRSGLFEGLRDKLMEVEESNREVTLFYLDLDHFKAVNDTHGHLAGDEVLRSAAERMRATLPDGSTLARIGGDEFVALIPDVTRDRATALSNDLIEAVSRPYQLEGGEQAQISASVGISRAKRGDGPDDLLHSADAALYNAKSEGRGRSIRATSRPPHEPERQAFSA